MDDRARGILLRPNTECEGAELSLGCPALDYDVEALGIRHCPTSNH